MTSHQTLGVHSARRQPRAYRSTSQSSRQASANLSKEAQYPVRLNPPTLAERFTDSIDLLAGCATVLAALIGLGCGCPKMRS